MACPTMDEHKVRFSRLELVRQRVFLVYYGKLRANVPFPERDPDHGSDAVAGVRSPGRQGRFSRRGRFL